MTNLTITFHDANSDAYGNPRRVVHFLDFLSNEERNSLPHDAAYSTAKSRAKELGYRVYTANWFGGGFVKQVWNEPAEAARIVKLAHGL